jgi:hypothetical protein
MANLTRRAFEALIDEIATETRRNPQEDLK